MNFPLDNDNATVGRMVYVSTPKKPGIIIESKPSARRDLERRPRTRHPRPYREHILVRVVWLKDGSIEDFDSSILKDFDAFYEDAKRKVDTYGALREELLSKNPDYATLRMMNKL